MSWLAVCDLCGFDFYNYELSERWDGLMTCKKDFENRHPQDFLKARKEESQKVPWTRSEPADLYVVVNYTYTPAPPPDGTFTQGL